MADVSPLPSDVGGSSSALLAATLATKVTGDARGGTTDSWRGREASVPPAADADDEVGAVLVSPLVAAGTVLLLLLLLPTVAS